MTLKLFIFLISSLLITPSFQSSNAEDVIIKKAEEAILQQFKNEKFRVELSARWIPGSLRSLNGSQVISVEPVGELRKYSSFEVTYRDANRRENTEVQLQIQAEQWVPVLIERKLRGEEIREDDLEWRWISIDLNRDQPVTELKEIEGKTLRRSLLAGQFITLDKIGKPYLIAAGDEVEMLYKQHGLQVILRCDSRQDGAMGEDIQIYCKETRKKYLARITGTGKTKWLQTQ